MAFGDKTDSFLPKALSRGQRLAAATFVLCTSAIGLYVSDYIEEKLVAERKAAMEQTQARQASNSQEGTPNAQ